MPRTKGAKNKIENTIKKLKELGYEITKNNTDSNQQQSENNDVSVESIRKNTENKTSITIEKPKISDKETFEKNNNLNQDILKCGNRLCNKILDKEYTTCPFCGISLSWQ